MPSIHIEGFWNLPVNPARCVPGFMEERKADNEHSNPQFYCPLPLNSHHLHFQFTVASLLKNFVRSRRDWEKKCREGSRQHCTIKICKIHIDACSMAGHSTGQSALLVNQYLVVSDVACIAEGVLAILRIRGDRIRIRLGKMLADSKYQRPSSDI